MKATVMGLGLFGGGLAVARHLVALGHDVTVTDLKDAAALAPSVAALEGTGVRLRLGGHDDADFTGADLVIVNPAVPPGNRYVAAARDGGARIDTEVGLFLRACPARVIGVTGSAGKSTTSALLAACLAGGDGRVFFGGNIGRSLLPDLPGMGADDLVVMELSSFQLHWLRREGRRPSIGVFTNLSPNHLDWHGTVEAYFEDKTGIVPAQDGVLVVNALDTHARRLAAQAPCRVVWASSQAQAPGPDAVVWRDGRLVQVSGGGERDLLGVEDVRLLGIHAPGNVAAAAAAALAAGLAPGPLREGVRAFEGLAHRLKPIGVHRGVRWVDDSKSTTPEAAAGALRAFEGRVLLLAGGYDKGLDPAPMLDEAARRDVLVHCYGTTGPALHRGLVSRGCASRTALFATLSEAVAAACAVSREGDVLLLSPGHASWDQYENYEARAREFARLAQEARRAGEG